MHVPRPTRIEFNFVTASPTFDVTGLYPRLCLGWKPEPSSAQLVERSSPAMGHPYSGPASYIYANKVNLYDLYCDNGQPADPLWEKMLNNSSVGAPWESYEPHGRWVLSSEPPTASRSSETKTRPSFPVSSMNSFSSFIDLWTSFYYQTYDRASASVPQFNVGLNPPWYKQWNLSSNCVAHSNGRFGDREPYVHESMRVRFDTPNEHVLAWRWRLKVRNEGILEQKFTC